LFIEETWSELKTNSLFEVLDAVYENQGQLTFNTNQTLAQFGAMFGPTAGPAIVRRVGEMCKVYDLFPQESA
jgi:DNA replication protein DnaC